nr:putative reverse transcriptase domain-containing protein [Tanacetum cinerariifolium]
MYVRRIEEEVDLDFLSDAHSRTGPVESVERIVRFPFYLLFADIVDTACIRELVMKYKAKKVCHEEMVKMPLVDLNVLEDGSFRICMDYRKLAEIAIRNRYHQLRAHEDEIPKTYFRTRYGHFEFTTSCHRVYRRHLGLHKVKGGARVAFEDEFGAAEEREVLCEAQQGRIGVKRKLFGSFRKKIGDVRTLVMEEAHATKYSVRPGVTKM